MSERNKEKRKELLAKGDQFLPQIDKYKKILDETSQKLAKPRRNRSPLPPAQRLPSSPQRSRFHTAPGRGDGTRAARPFAAAVRGQASLLVVQAAPVDLRSWHCRVAVSQKASPAHRVLAVHGWPSTGITAHVNCRRSRARRW